MIKKHGKRHGKRSKHEREKVESGIFISNFIIKGDGGMQVCGVGRVKTLKLQNIVEIRFQGLRIKHIVKA